MDDTPHWRFNTRHFSIMWKGSKSWLSRIPFTGKTGLGDSLEVDEVVLALWEDIGTGQLAVSHSSIAQSAQSVLRQLSVNPRHSYRPQNAPVAHFPCQVFYPWDVQDYKRRLGVKTSFILSFGQAVVSRGQTPISPCKPGWVDWGGRCFYMSTGTKNWWEPCWNLIKHGLLTNWLTVSVWLRFLRPGCCIETGLHNFRLVLISTFFNILSSYVVFFATFAPKMPVIIDY